MPNLNVCTGPAFGVGSLGELEPANVRPVAWPFSSNPTTAAAQMQTANGLRYDQITGTPGGGLWVPEVGPAATMSRQTGSPGTAMASNTTLDAATSAVPFQNVSTVQTMTVLAVMTCMIWMQTSGSAWVELWAGATLSPASVQIAYETQDGDYSPNAYQWHGAFTDSLAFTVPPLTTVNFVPRLTAKNVTGASVTFAGWRCVVSAFSALLDPTTEG